MEYVVDFCSGLLVGGLAAISPGPDTVLVLRSVAAGGPRAGAKVSFGIGAALATHGFVTVAAAAAGRGRIGDHGLRIVGWAGAAYFVFLGASLLRAAAARGGPPDTRAVRVLPPRRFFLQGYFGNLTNAKAVLLFAAILYPSVAGGTVGRGAAVVAGVAGAVPLWFLILSYASSAILRRVSDGRRRLIDAAAGLLFVALAFLSLAALPGGPRSAGDETTARPAGRP